MTMLRINPEYHKGDDGPQKLAEWILFKGTLEERKKRIFQDLWDLWDLGY